MTHREGRTLPIHLIAGTSFAAAAARGLLVPLYAHDAGADRVAVGALFTVFMITAAGLSLPAGYLADRFGRRALVVFSIVAGGLSQLLAATTTDVRVLLVCQAIGGLGGAAASTALMASLADVVPPQRIGRSMGWMTFAMQIGFLAGPALSGLALNVVSVRADLALTAVFYLIALPLAYSVPGGRRHGATQSVGASLREAARGQGFAAALVAVVALCMLWGTVQAYLPVYAREGLGIPANLIGLMLAAQAVVNGISRLVAGRTVDRARRRLWLVVGGISLYGAATIALPHVSGFAGSTLLLAVSVPCVAIAFVALGAVFADLATDRTRGIVMGVYNAVLYGGLGLGPALVAPLMQASYTLGFTAIGLAAIGLAAAVPAVRWNPWRERGALAQAPGA